MGAEIPAALANAGDGIPTLLTLQEGFAEPARAALDASIRADMGDGWANRLTSFLRSQSGARSLTPHEGADPDAVLSRAEAALCGGTLVFALPGSTGAVKLALEKIILPQLDSRTKPCNFAELLPRVRGTARG